MKLNTKMVTRVTFRIYDSEFGRQLDELLSKTECCFSGRMDKVTLLVHDADKSHRILVKSKGLKENVIKSYPKTEESLKAMAPINNYSALLVNEMRKHPGTKAIHLNERLCFISYKAMLNARYGEMSGTQILLSEIIKSEKTVKFEKYKAKGEI